MAKSNSAVKYREGTNTVYKSARMYAQIVTELVRDCVKGSRQSRLGSNSPRFRSRLPREVPNGCNGSC